jgi:hypothetical protein
VIVLPRMSREAEVEVVLAMIGSFRSRRPDGHHHAWTAPASAEPNVLLMALE